MSYKIVYKYIAEKCNFQRFTTIKLLQLYSLRAWLSFNFICQWKETIFELLWLVKTKNHTE